MSYHEQSEDYRPLFWMGGRPIYAHTLLILLHIVAFIGMALTLGTFGSSAYYAVRLDPDEVIHRGQIWRLATYIVFPPSLWFVFALGFLYFAGKEVEQFTGRSVFLKLYAALVLIPAVLLCAVGFFLPMLPVIGGSESIFGVFVAFATIYPGIVIPIWFVNLTAKGWAWVLLIVYSLIDFSVHDWSALLVLWACAGVGYGGMRFIGAGSGMTWLTDWIEERRAARLAHKHNIKVLEDTKAAESIDAILEKISKHGVGSLNASERNALEQARTNLLKRDQQ